MGGGPPEGRGPRRGPRPALDRLGQPRVLCVRLAAAGAQERRRPQERPECLLARGIGCSGPSGGPSALSPRSPGLLHRASPAPVPARGRVSRSCVACWRRWASLPPSLSGSPGPPPPGPLRSCAAPLRTRASLCARQTRWWACTAPWPPLGAPCTPSIFSFRALPVCLPRTPPEQVGRAPRPALCRRVPQAIAGLCAVQERRAGWSPRAGAARRRGTGLGRAAGRGARRGARLEAVSAGPPGAAARRCPAGQPRGWRPAAGVPLVLARRALAPGPVG